MDRGISTFWRFYCFSSVYIADTLEGGFHLSPNAIVHVCFLSDICGGGTSKAHLGVGENERKRGRRC